MQLLSRASRNEDGRRRNSSGKESEVVYTGPQVEKPSVFEKQGRAERKRKEGERAE